MTLTLSTSEAKALFQSKGWEWDDKYLGADVKPRKRKRSVEHNAYYWSGIVTPLADFVGMSKDEAHNEILAEYHGYDLVEFRGTVIKRPKGRSSTLTSEDFDKLCLIGERMCAMAGVPVDRGAA